MDTARGTWGTLIVSLGLTALLLQQLSARYPSPYPPLQTSVQGSKTSLQDVSGIVLGVRRLMADLAWIQTLHYYGTPEEGQSGFDFHNGIGNYPDFLAHCLHVARMDPYFTYVYYYGGASLGWNLNRLNEAEQLLREGIAHNPREWRLPQYLAGLAYQKNHDNANLLAFLESITQDPDCPLLMKALLANIYKKTHRYLEAIRLWEDVYASGDREYAARAIIQVQEIRDLMKADLHRPGLTK